MGDAAAKAEKKQERLEKARAKLEKRLEKLENAGKFKAWRSRRPFWGATFSVLAGLLILYIPIQLYAIAFVPGSFAFIGLLFGVLVLILGVLSYIFPQFSTVLGVITMFLSILSIMGALGGFLLGTILGLIGGALCIGWEEHVIAPDANGPDQMNRPDKGEKAKTNLIDTSEVASSSSSS
ncbi:DUF6114 domain-containing protein [Caenibacillus caldisaponilyticus]|uniref:DUF6114 domain-containing protein n=1 Tax=Caenibacillus caldisaponilyticus TaxID=1674942 RepID=UPI0009888504|nr:DUF6114 domain-containing protein [Caenibacillus caldisaponilyticus]